MDITIDGKFSELVWQAAKWEDHFIQHQPIEGEPPYQQTEFAILYDDNNVYVAIKALDKSPDSISMRITKRDVTDGDLVAVLFDTYFDKRTAFGFGVSAAGVKSDFNVKEFLSNLVMRWEYRPGSTVYLVWSQTRSL